MSHPLAHRPRMSESPKITVLMAVFNGGRYLQAALDSVRAQSHRDFEFLVVDDGSTDATADILRACPDPRFKLLHNDANLGLTRSLNRGLELARGAYVARMDADDVCHPERLARQLAFLEARPGVGVAGTDCVHIEADGRRMFRSSFTGEHGFLQWYLFFQNPIAHPSVMMRTNLVRQAGGYREAVRVCQDHDLWWRLALQSRLSNLAEPLLHLRRHSGSITGRHSREQQAACAQIQQEMLPHVLGRDRSEALRLAVEAEPSTPARRARFILELLSAYRATHQLSPQEMRLVERDAAFRLGVLALRHPGLGRTPRLFARAHRLDGLACLRLLVWPVQRYLLRHVTNCVLRK
jgi:hypothetical protein